MKKKVLTALILLIILVIIIVWKRWLCLECREEKSIFVFDVPGKVDPPGPPCSCKCITPLNDIPSCNSQPRYWLPGSDVDAQSVSDPNFRSLMLKILDFATWNTVGDGTHKFLWVESKNVPSPSHVTSASVLPLLGLTLGIDYDWVDGTEFLSVDVNLYTAICTASSQGGSLTSSELNALQSRSLELQQYHKHGGGFAVFPALITNGYSWLPISITTSNFSSSSGFTPTAAGSSLGLTSIMLNHQHEVSFVTYPQDILLPLEMNGTTITGLVSDPQNKENPCLDKKVTVPDYTGLCSGPHLEREM